MPFTHSHDISNYTGASPLSPLCPPCLLGGLLSMWRSHWRKCQLNLKSLHTAVRLLSTVTRDLQQRVGPVYFITTGQCALWYGGWCAAGSAFCTLESDYRPLTQGAKHWSNRNRLSTEAWEMYPWIDRPFYSGQETQICRCWTAGRHLNLHMGNMHSWNMVYN